MDVEHLVRDHHDYAKRRKAPRESPSSESSLDPTAAKKGRPGRPQRDPEGGTYMSARSRARKAPLPMKLRALPASFWEQPNLNKGPSPGTIFSALPPLCKHDCVEAETEARRLSPAARGKGPGPATGRGSSYAGHGDPVPHVSHSPADTELLFSLFHTVETTTTANRRRTRGRPRRSAPTSGAGAGLAAGAGPGHRDDDPCLLDSLTGGLLPASRRLDGLGSLGVLGLGGGRGVSALRASVVDNNNLAQILSDLVVKL